MHWNNTWIFHFWLWILLIQVRTQRIIFKFIGTIKSCMLRWYEQKLHYNESNLESYSCFHDIFTDIFVIVLVHLTRFPGRKTLTNSRGRIDEANHGKSNIELGVQRDHSVMNSQSFIALKPLRLRKAQRLAWPCVLSHHVLMFTNTQLRRRLWA